jgi:hypothetical protein
MQEPNNHSIPRKDTKGHEEENTLGMQRLEEKGFIFQLRMKFEA